MSALGGSRHSAKVSVGRKAARWARPYALTPCPRMRLFRSRLIYIALLVEVKGATASTASAKEAKRQAALALATLMSTPKPEAKCARWVAHFSGLMAGMGGKRTLAPTRLSLNELFFRRSA